MVAHWAHLQDTSQKATAVLSSRLYRTTRLNRGQTSLSCPRDALISIEVAREVHTVEEVAKAVRHNSVGRVSITSSPCRPSIEQMCYRELAHNRMFILVTPRLLHSPTSRQLVNIANRTSDVRCTDKSSTGPSQLH